MSTFTQKTLRFWQFMFLAMCCAGVFSACNNDDEEEPGNNNTGYTVPTAYSEFTNVSLTEATDLLSMWQEFGNEMKRGNTPNTVLDANKLKEMYRNQGAHYSQAFTGSLSAITFAADTTYFLNALDQLAQASTSTTLASEGVAGVIISPNDSNVKYLVDANGLEVMQLVEKGLLGAAFYYQIAEFYTRDAFVGPGVDNTNVTEGIGTPRQHNWDLAFGMFGAPLDFPNSATLSQARAVARYCNSRNAILGTNNTVLQAYLRGRAAINNNDNNTVTTQAQAVREAWEVVLAATAINYFNRAAGSENADIARRLHALSEGIAFVRNLKYSTNARITAAQITQIENLIGTNFWQTTADNMRAARNILADVYGFDETVRASL
jgi:hypothetical protein